MTQGDTIAFWKSETHLSKRVNFGKWVMDSRSVRVVEGGKMVIPAAFRRQMGVRVGDTLIADLVDGELRIRPRNLAVANAQKLMRALVPEGISLADELSAERRAEALRE